jgi:PASTA domain
MAKLFQITLPEGLSTLNLDSQGRGTVHYSVKNVSARPIDARAVLVCLPQGDSNNSIQKNWISLDGKAERHFAVNGEDTFTANVTVPSKSPAGTYSYRLDVVSAAKPDEGDSSQPTKFTVVPGAPPPRKWGLIAAIIAAVIVVAGIGIWFATRPSTPSVPNLVGMTVANATTALTSAKLTLNPTQLQVPGSAASVGTVVAQAPAAGTSVAANSSVQISVGVPQKVTVPSLLGMTVAQAQQALPSGLTLGAQSAASAYNASYPVGAIVTQSPAASTSVNSGTTITVTLNPAQAISPVQQPPRYFHS